MIVQALEGGAQGVGVAGAEEDAGLAVAAYFAGPVDVVGDGADAAEQGLGDGAWEALAVAGMGKNIHGADHGWDALRGDEAGEEDGGAGEVL